MLLRLRRMLIWTFAIGAISFAVGFFGPMIVVPGANQGPLLGILITGPIGVIVGMVVGIGRELLGHTDGPVQVFARTGLLDFDRHQVLRSFAAIGGVILAVYGVIGLRRGEGRGAAASIVVAIALLWYAAAGRIPSWFRR